MSATPTSPTEPEADVITLQPINFRDEATVDEYLSGLTAGGRYELVGYTIEDIGGKRPFRVTARRRPVAPAAPESGIS